MTTSQWLPGAMDKEEDGVQRGTRKLFQPRDPLYVLIVVVVTISKIISCTLKFMNLIVCKYSNKQKKKKNFFKKEYRIKAKYSAHQISAGQ